MTTVQWKYFISYNNCKNYTFYSEKWEWEERKQEGKGEDDVLSEWNII